MADGQLQIPIAPGAGGYSNIYPQSNLLTGFTTGGTDSTGQGTNISQQYIPDYPQAPLLQAIAQYAFDQAPQVYQWGMNTYNKNQGNIDGLLRDALSYASPQRISVDMGMAEAGVQQGAEQARQSAIRDLESYGIDPSSGRYAALDQANRVQASAAAAGAGNQQRMADIAAGNAMRNQAISASLQNTQLGYQAAQEMARLLGTGMQLRYPPLGTTASGQRTQESTSRNLSEQFAPRQPTGPAGPGGGPAGGGGAPQRAKDPFGQGPGTPEGRPAPDLTGTAKPSGGGLPGIVKPPGGGGGPGGGPGQTGDEQYPGWPVYPDPNVTGINPDDPNNPYNIPTDAWPGAYTDPAGNLYGAEPSGGWSWDNPQTWGGQQVDWQGNPIDTGYTGTYDPSMDWQYDPNQYDQGYTGNYDPSMDFTNYTSQYDPETAAPWQVAGGNDWTVPNQDPYANFDYGYTGNYDPSMDWANQDQAWADQWNQDQAQWDQWNQQDQSQWDNWDQQAYDQSQWDNWDQQAYDQQAYDQSQWDNTNYNQPDYSDWGGNWGSSDTGEETFQRGGVVGRRPPMPGPMQTGYRPRMAPRAPRGPSPPAATIGMTPGMNLGTPSGIMPARGVAPPPSPVPGGPPLMQQGGLIQRRRMMPPPPFAPPLRRSINGPNGPAANGPPGPAATTGGFVSRNLSPSAGARTDDVAAKLNAGEFVIPKDVAHWKGKEFFYKLIAQARKNRSNGGMPVRPQRTGYRPNG